MAFTPPKVGTRLLEKCARTDVTHEVRQYCVWMFDNVPDCGNEDRTFALHQAKFTGAATSMRNLVEFLSNDRPTSKSFKTDLVADHYFAQHWTRRTKGSVQCLYASTPKRNEWVATHVNRHLSHLTTHRQTSRRADRSFSWTVDVDYQRVLEAFKLFVEDLQLAHPKRAAWFSEAYDLVTARLDNMPVFLGEYDTSRPDEAATPTNVTYVGSRACDGGTGGR